VAAYPWIAKLVSALRAPQKAVRPNDPWRTFALERDLDYSTSYTADGGLLPKRRTMTGSVSGIVMRIELGKLAKVSAQISSVGDGKMSVYSDNTLVDMATISAPALSDTGDEDFDAHFFLRGTEQKLAEQLLTVDVRHALLRFSTEICLDYDSGELSLTLPTDGIDVPAVDAACDIIVAACKPRPSAGAYR
jgi:hypothetical protein